MKHRRNLSVIVCNVAMIVSIASGAAGGALSASPLPGEYPHNRKYDSAFFVNATWQLARSGAFGRLHDTIDGIFIREVWLDTILYSPNFKYAFSIVGLRVERMNNGMQSVKQEFYAGRYLVLEHEDSLKFHLYPILHEDTFVNDSSRSGAMQKTRRWLFKHYDVDGSTSKLPLWDDPRLRNRPRTTTASTPSIEEYKQLGRYAVGQAWRYRTRPGEEKSRLTIVKILKSEDLGELYVVYVTGVQVKSPNHAGGVQNMIPHLVVSRQSLDASVTEIADANAPMKDFLDDYARSKWLLEKGMGPMFTDPVADVIMHIEEVMSRPKGQE